MKKILCVFMLAIVALAASVPTAVACGGGGMSPVVDADHAE